MSTSPARRPEKRRTDDGIRRFAQQAFLRSAGAPLVGGNHIELLRDAAGNYPAWLEAIRGARERVYFENYILADDRIGTEFAAALIERARAGVEVRLIYDWLGSFRRSSRAFWARLRAGGVEVRCYNPPQLGSPLGWVSRDHRKLLVIDGRVGFVSGLCVADMWVGDPLRDIGPWRDTGVQIHGPAVADLEHAFARTWAMLGSPLLKESLPESSELSPAGNTSVRIVATEPATSGMFRLDQLVVAFARKRIWITDAYYLATPTYVQALITAARDGVDVRMLLPRATDIPLLKLMSRVGYRPLLQAGVQIYEWNGTLVHAKTAVVDGRWSRVGSTNLNLASWIGNCELDAVIEDEPFALEMEAMYLDDLAHATEIILEGGQKIRPIGRRTRRRARRRRGSAGRATAGAVRIGNVLGAALTNRRVIEPIESRMLVWISLVLLGLAALIVYFPRVLAYPAGLLLTWMALALLYRSFRRRR